MSFRKDIPRRAAARSRRRRCQSGVRLRQHPDHRSLGEGGWILATFPIVHKSLIRFCPDSDTVNLSSFPLDRGRRLGGNVVDNAVYAAHLVDYAIEYCANSVPTHKAQCQRRWSYNQCKIRQTKDYILFPKSASPDHQYNGLMRLARSLLLGKARDIKQRNHLNDQNIRRT